MKTQTAKFRSPLLLLLTAAVWGIAFVAQSVGMDYVGPFTFSFSRNLLGCASLLPIIWFLGRKNADKSSGLTAEEKKAGRKTLLTGGVCCGIVLFIASNLQQVGIQYTSVGKAGFITACYIVIVPILGLFMKKKSSPFIWAAVVLALIGLYLLCITESFSIGLGDLLMLLCAFTFSLHILVIDHFSPLVDGVKMSCIQFLVCGLLSAVAALIAGETISLTNLLHAWQPIVYAGVMSCGVGYTLQIVGQKDMNPTVASLILSLESCFSVLAGWIILGQRLSAREILGCVTMFGAIILAQLPQKKS